MSTSSSANHGRSGRPWQRIRKQVLERDNYTCQIGGPKCRGYGNTVDHRVPLSVAPELAHDLDNLRAACGPCQFAGGAAITNAKRGGQQVRRPEGVEFRATYSGAGRCPVSNHGSICAGGHLVDVRSWRPEYGAAASWPDGDYCPS